MPDLLELCRRLGVESRRLRSMLCMSLVRQCIAPVVSHSATILHFPAMVVLAANHCIATAHVLHHAVTIRAELAILHLPFLVCLHLLEVPLVGLQVFLMIFSRTLERLECSLESRVGGRDRGQISGAPSLAPSHPLFCDVSQLAARDVVVEQHVAGRTKWRLGVLALRAVARKLPAQVPGVNGNLVARGATNHGTDPLHSPELARFV
mmetsp:Transcript_20743/g.57949  ORF Transcript_20743/g.57949 Transcript_20743/m.57949 type:complete len:207 (+) Transcript_20743:375-995(+)